MKRSNVEYMDAQPLHFAPAGQAVQVTRAEADQAVNVLVEAYAAKYKVSYPEAFTAIRTKAPGLINGWVAIRKTTGE